MTNSDQDDELCRKKVKEETNEPASDDDQPIEDYDDMEGLAGQWSSIKSDVQQLIRVAVQDATRSSSAAGQELHIVDTQSAKRAKDSTTARNIKSEERHCITHSESLEPVIGDPALYGRRTRAMNLKREVTQNDLKEFFKKYKV